VKCLNNRQLRSCHSHCCHFLQCQQIVVSNRLFYCSKYCISSNTKKEKNFRIRKVYTLMALLLLYFLSSFATYPKILLLLCIAAYSVHISFARCRIIIYVYLVHFLHLGASVPVIFAAFAWGPKILLILCIAAYSVHTSFPRWHFFIYAIVIRFEIIPTQNPYFSTRSRWTVITVSSDLVLHFR